VKRPLPADQSLEADLHARDIRDGVQGSRLSHERDAEGTGTRPGA
jgi:hypothetical protein